MTTKTQIYVISFLLICASLAIVFYKVNYLDYSLLPTEKRSVWSIEAKISFYSQKRRGALISFAIPDEQKGFRFYNENATSLNFGYNKIKEKGLYRAEWSKRQLVRGKHTLYYSIDLMSDQSMVLEEDEEDVINDKIPVEKIEEESSILQVIDGLMDEVEGLSSNNLSMTSLLIKKLKEDSSQNIRMLKKRFVNTNKDYRDLIVMLLKSRGVNTRKLGALVLMDGTNNASLKPMFEVSQQGKWYLFDSQEGRLDSNQQLFIWQRGGVSLLDTEGVRASKVRFSITEHVIPAQKSLVLKAQKEKDSFVNYSLTILPNESQNTFKFLLLIPLGAFMIVLFRVFIGLKTSGTFMPILIAMAFLQTKLIPGIIMFVLVVAIGLMIRSYLSSLNLLLVARISAVLVIMVIFIAIFTIVAYKLGAKDTLTITFFPMIILAWTVERMSILWEEDGPNEVLKQGAGSLFVAISIYFLMTNHDIEYLLFNFPELLLAVLGGIILVGRYNGYRLSELHRFASLKKNGAL